MFLEMGGTFQPDTMTSVSCCEYCPLKLLYAEAFGANSIYESVYPHLAELDHQMRFNSSLMLDWWR